MAQLLPDKDKQGPLAWMLLIGAAFIVYWLGFSWYFERRAELSDQAGSLLESEARFVGAIDQREELGEALDGVRQFEQENDYFLAEGNASLPHRV